jgi:hypothetical protein
MAAALLARTDAAAGVTPTGELPPGLPLRSMPVSSSAATLAGGWSPAQPQQRGLLGLVLSEPGGAGAQPQPLPQLAAWPAAGAAAAALAAQAAPPAAVVGGAKQELFAVRVSLKASGVHLRSGQGSRAILPPCCSPCKPRCACLSVGIPCTLAVITALQSN